MKTKIQNIQRKFTALAITIAVLSASLYIGWYWLERQILDITMPTSSLSHSDFFVQGQ